ncbi:GNAT family N-acetyltransferase [Ruegeria sp. HKCCD7318]|uniref:GNAT family N-acetyltransferase n=1 Tax=Ruegeria sp. HKCCD7318 TaxID=2683014 RepID=UPI001491E1AD|nr:GNAT family N-acetyltransferase [Ruegeria sp. HKCCD7318]NOE32316.1 hypothetical protein [Ruegeria sp. HKCCD7318]
MLDLPHKELIPPQNVNKFHYVLEPEPDPWFAEQYAEHGWMIPIRGGTPIRIHNRIETMSQVFRAEVGRGTGSPRPTSNEFYLREWRPYAFVTKDGLFVGFFNLHLGSNNRPTELSWIWIHPDYRGKGILKTAYRRLRDEFGDFMILPPYSPAMVQFIKDYRDGYEMKDVVHYVNRFLKGVT